MHDHDASTGALPAGGGRAGLAAAMWASLLPLMLILHPYSGLVQDARIYFGRGVADRDPAGVGRDMLFVHDGQTGFSLMGDLISVALGVMGPGVAAMALTFAGEVLWLLAAAALARTLASGRAAWAVAVCTVALPSFYGAFDLFDCTEAIATPRVFAQAAVLGALAAVTTGRRGSGLGLLSVAVAIHPLIALPGVAVAAVLLVRQDRRWLAAVAAGALGILAAAAAGLPVAARLFQPMDAVWLSILRSRSTYLFPTLWPAGCFGAIACQGAAVIVASAVSTPAVRALLLAALGVAASGLAASWLFGDVLASTLIVQLQPWRALWLLAILGDVAFALAAIGLWRRGPDACIAFAPLALAWLWSDHLALVLPLSALTLVWLAALLRDAVPPASRLILLTFAGAVSAVVLLTTSDTLSMAVALFRSASSEGGEVVWPMVVGLGIQTPFLVAAALALAFMPLGGTSAPVRRGMVAGVACAVPFAVWVWDGRTGERITVERDAPSPTLRAAVGARPGEVLWIGEDSESWFALGRPSFLNSAQAGPILFSRDLALEWSSRVHLLLELGLARPENAAPWGAVRSTAADLAFGSDAVERFCADGRHPAALVAPGDRRSAAPAGASATLWRPPQPFHRIAVESGEVHWTTSDLFTVIRCPAPGGADGRSGDARSLG